MARLGVVATAVAFGCLFSTTAGAEERAHDKASAAFQEGRKLLEQGNCDAAVPKLRESLQWEPSVGARLGMAECLEKSDPARAWLVLKEASALALVNHDERIAIAEEHAAKLQVNLATILFVLPETRDQVGFELRIDGELVDRYLYKAGYATVPGKHEIEARSPGRQFRTSIALDAGQHTTVDVVLRGEDCTDANVGKLGPVVESDRGGSRRTLGLALGGLGVAGLTTGVIFGILTLDKKRTIEDACGGSVGSCGAQRGSVDAETEAAKTSAALSTVGFALGAASLVAGTVIYLTAPSPNRSPRVGIRVGPHVARSGGGVAVGGTW